jgi:tetratricopeptide (TPR) repeat protein
MYFKKLLNTGIFLVFLGSCTNSPTTTTQNATDSAVTNNPVAELEEKIGTDTLVADSLRASLVEKLVETNQVEKAVAQIDLLLKKQPGNPAYLFMKADAMERKGDTIAAIELFEQSITAAGSFADAELRLAHLYAETGNPNTLQLCNTMLKQAAAIKMRSDILHIKGIYYSHIQDRKNAIKTFNQIIQEDYTYLDAYIEKGLVYYDEQKFAEALKVFKLSTNVKNSFADGYFWMAKAEEKLNKKEDAINNYKRALALDQSIEEARDALKRLQVIQ